MQHARSLFLACALCASACRFEPAPLTGAPGPSPAPDAAAASDATAPGAVPDAAIDTGPDAAVDAGPPAAFCDRADPALVGCFRFDDVTNDASGAGLPVSAVNVDFDQGVSGRAAVFSADSSLHITETPALDVSAVTMEMWVRPDALPVDPARAGLFDNSGQYGIFVLDGATVRCTGGGGQALQAGALTAGVWTHVACVHDGQGITLYIDGTVAATDSAGPLGTASSEGSNIGGDNPDGDDDFLGRIDELRIWSRARTAAEVCEAAGCVGGDRIPAAR
jgi:hypothetical protein